MPSSKHSVDPDKDANKQQILRLRVTSIQGAFHSSQYSALGHLDALHDAAHRILRLQSSGGRLFGRSCFGPSTSHLLGFLLLRPFSTQGTASFCSLGPGFLRSLFLLALRRFSRVFGLCCALKNFLAFSSLKSRRACRGTRCRRCCSSRRVWLQSQ